MLKKIKVLFFYDLALLLWSIVYIVETRDLIYSIIRLLSILTLCVTYWVFALNNFQNEQLAEYKNRKVVLIMLLVNATYKVGAFFGFIYINELIRHDLAIGIALCGLIICADCLINILIGKLISRKGQMTSQLVVETGKLENEVVFSRVVILYLLSILIVVMSLAQLFLLVLNKGGGYCQIFKLVIVMAFIHSYISTEKRTAYIPTKRLYLALSFFLLEFTLSFVFLGTQNKQYILISICAISTVMFEGCICAHIGTIVHKYTHNK